MLCLLWFCVRQGWHAAGYGSTGCDEMISDRWTGRMIPRFQLNTLTILGIRVPHRRTTP